MFEAQITIESPGTVYSPLTVRSNEEPTIIKLKGQDDFQNPRVGINTEGTLFLQQSTMPATRPLVKHRSESALVLSEMVAKDRTSIFGFVSEDIVPSDEHPRLVTTIIRAKIPINSISIETGGGTNLPSTFMQETASTTITITRSDQE